MYGFIGLLSMLFSLIVTLFWIAVIATVVLLVAKLFSRNKYDEDSVLERWTAVLRGQAGRESDFLKRVEAALEEARLPFRVYRTRIPVSMVSNETYEFVVCEMNSDYSCYISCVPAGTDLEVSWLIQDHMIRGVYRTPVLGPLLISVLKRYTFAMGNKIRAFAGATHSCAMLAAEGILDGAHADKSRLNRKTSGRLGPL